MMNLVAYLPLFVVFISSLLEVVISNSSQFARSSRPISKGIKWKIRRSFLNPVPPEVRLLEYFFPTGKKIRGDDVNFYLFSKKMRLNITDSTDSNEHRKVEGRVFFLIHGYLADKNNTWYYDLTNLLLEKYPESLVIQVDWGKFALKYLYSTPASYTEVIGKKIAIIINIAIKEFRTPLENFILIGHSLGAQICGSIGKEFFKKTTEKIPRIIALDPAQPIYRKTAKSKRLNKFDAETVMVIHTDPVLGFQEPCGTIDFYPNGGKVQPGCYEVPFQDFFTCSHARSYQYFIEALKTPKYFMAKKCLGSSCRYKMFDETDVVSIGDIETKKTGLYYLETTDRHPYYLL